MFLVLHINIEYVYSFILSIAIDSNIIPSHISSLSLLSERTALLSLPNLMACTRRWWSVAYAGRAGAWCWWCRWEDVKPEQRKNVTASPANSLQHNLILPSGDNILLPSVF